MKDKIKEMLNKFKSSRKAQIGLCVIIVAVIILGYLLFLRSPTKQNETQEVVTAEQTEEETYARSLEEKLETLLCSIKDAGKVKVMVSLKGGFEYVYVTEKTVKETSSGQVTNEQVVLVGGKPVIEKTIYPVIKGVLVSSSGAKDVSVKLRLIEAVQTVLDVANEDITILSGN